eukprot:354314-Chlamydomonas_euryale.AAC.15
MPGTKAFEQLPAKSTSEAKTTSAEAPEKAWFPGSKDGWPQGLQECAHTSLVQGRVHSFDSTGSYLPTRVDCGRPGTMPHFSTRCLYGILGVPSLVSTIDARCKAAGFIELPPVVTYAHVYVRTGKMYAERKCARRGNITCGIHGVCCPAEYCRMLWQGFCTASAANQEASI